MELKDLAEAIKHNQATYDFLHKEALKFDWQHLAMHGLKILSIMKHREENKTTLADSKKAVEAFIEQQMV